MDNFKFIFLKALFMLLLVYEPSYSFKYPLNKRQNNLCQNQAVGAFVSNPLDCRKFYMCAENGEAVTASCPQNMFFNPDTHICDTSAHVKCQQTTLMPSTNPIATTPPSNSETPTSSVMEYCLNIYNQQPNSDSLIFLAHPSNCKRYYMCYYGQALLQECSTDLQWNSRTGKCDLPSNAKCQQESGSNTKPIVPTESIPNGGNVNGNGGGNNGIVCPAYGQHIFPNMQRCDFFIYCVKGHAILQKCPFYEYFDVKSSRCQWRKMSLCIKDLKFEYRKNTF